MDDEEIVLNEKCDIEGHEHYDLVALCLDEECTAPKRLACSKCLVFNHGDHTNACLFLEDLKDPKKLALKAWSKDNLGKQVEQYLKENENIEEEIDKMMDKLLEDIIDETNKAKNVMRRKRVEGKTEVQKTAKQIQAKYEAAYDIKHIRSILVDYMDDKISEESLNQKLEEVIKAREEIEELNRKNKLVASYPVIDKEFLQEKQDALLEIISSLSHTIRIPNSWVFLKAKVGNNHLIKEIQQGKTFEFNENQSHQILYGSEIMKEGVHSWTIKVEMIKKKDNEKEEEKKEEPVQQPPNPLDNQGLGFDQGFGQPFGQNVNFQHADYQVLRNLYIGIVNDKKKDNQQCYAKQGFGGNVGQDAHSLDIIRNQLVGGYLFFSGTATKQMSQVFWEKRSTTGVELTITLDLEAQKIILKDKDGESQYEGNFAGLFKGISWRPYVCSMRSKVRVSILSSLNNQANQTYQTSYQYLQNYFS